MQIRINLGLSRQDVADRGDISPRVVERVETGYHANPQWETLKKIFRGLGIQLQTSHAGKDDEIQAPHLV